MTYPRFYYNISVYIYRFLHIYGKDGKMYNIIIPTVINSPSYNREKVLSEMKRAGAMRALLAIGHLNYDDDKSGRDLEILKSDIPYYKENGLEVGVWLWGLWVGGKAPFTKITGFKGEDRGEFMCPSDKEFVKYMQSFICKVAELSPDLILLDDDVRFGNHGEGFGCTCDNHLATMSEALGEKVVREGLYDRMFSGKPNKYRSAFMRACGKSLEDYCVSLREAVDRVNPEIRLGLCACISNYDTDGTDAFTMAKLLAGNTKPYLRLIGAPYWGARGGWGHRISDVIEFERQQRSRYDSFDMEIVPEGDPYPRPRYNVPAAYLEIFDTALRVSGGFSGIQKYMIDYNSTAFYETEYINRHIVHKPLYEAIERIFKDKNAAGVRIYEPLKKLESADFTHREHTVNTIPDMPFSRSFRFTSENAIPTVHTGSGVCGISFGENVRAYLSDSSVFEKPLVIDLPAARILTENGIDVGISKFCGRMTSSLEHFHDENEYAPSRPLFEGVELRDGARILSSYVIENSGDSEIAYSYVGSNKNEVPAAFTYVNKDGARFLVYTFDAQLSEENTYRSYARRDQFVNAMRDFGVTLPATVAGCPDLYVIAKKDERGNMAVGLWNCFADGVYDRYIELDGEYSDAEILNADCEFCKDKVLIKKLGAFEFCFINLTK